MPKYKNAYLAELDEEDKPYSEELAEEEARNQPAEDPGEGHPADDEATFKKRYGDLRRYMQQKDNQHRQELGELKDQLEDATKKQLKFPKTEEEIEAWSKKYPEVAQIVQTIAGMKAQEALQEGEKRLSKFEQMQQDITRKEAEAELLRLHPDFPDIRADQGFHDWVKEQPSYIQDALYKNSTDAKAAARAIDLYKADTGKGKKRKDAEDPRDAARDTGGRGAGPAPATRAKPSFKESQVARMSDAEYEKNEDAILEAMREGKFDYDLTGAAR